MFDCKGFAVEMRSRDNKYHNYVFKRWYLYLKYQG